jgi:adenylate kinase family enzyme
VDRIGSHHETQRHPSGERVIVIGNSGGGKSTLARHLARCRALPYIDIDGLVWHADWQLTPTDIYEAEHTALIARDRWLIDGLGHYASIPERVARATEIILIDLPLWVHFWLAAERQLVWSRQALAHLPAGIKEMPPTREVFRTIWEVDQSWMPGIRSLCLEAEREGRSVVHLTSIDDLNGFAESLVPASSDD